MLSISKDGEVFNWGGSEYIGREGDKGEIEKVPFFGEKVVSMSAGHRHFLAFCESGNIYSCFFFF